MDFSISTPRHAMKPSLDRIRPELGYVAGNVVWATNFANRARGDMPFEEFRVLMVELGFRPIDS